MRAWLRVTSTWSRRMARARGSATRSKRKRCRRHTAKPTRRRGHCWSARSSRTSGMHSKRPASPELSRPYKRFGMGWCPRRCIWIRLRPKWIGRPERSRWSVAHVPGRTEPDRPRRAAVSSFGISGTNAHVILEQAPPEFAAVPSARKRPPVHAVGVVREVERRHWPSKRPGCGGSSSRTPNWIRSDVAYSLVTTRALFDHRAVAVGACRDELLSGLAAIASGAPAPNVVTGKASATGGTVFVFPGQGSQWAGMAVELLDSAPAFADQMRLCDAAFAEFVDWSLLEVVRGGAGSPGLDRVDVVQPVLFAVMVSLAAQWRALGIEPDAVLGHSQGEIAAAYVAGALSLRDAAKVVALRSKAISAIAGTGGMVAIPRPVEQVLAMIEPWGQSISVAAQNGPSSTVVTGNAAALDELMAKCDGTKSGPRGFQSITPRIRPRWRRCGRRCASRFQGCVREPAISHSSPRSPAPSWTPRAWTATTGSPICANRCYSNRRSDGPTNTVTARSLNPVRIRC